MERHKTLYNVIFWVLFFGFWSLPFLALWFVVWFQSPGSNALREWGGMPQVTVKAVKPKTIPCKILDDESGTKECKVKMDDGRTVTCIVDSDGRSCDWKHEK